MTPESNNPRVLRGAQSHKQGYAFEDHVAELYRLLKYSVEHGRIFSGRQVDLFMTGQLGDLRVYRAVECKSGEVGTKEIDEFLLKLRLVQKEYPAASGTIVTSVSFTDAVSAHAAAEGINLVPYRELSAKLIDGHAYVNGLINDLETDERYKLQAFVEPRIGHSIDGQDQPGLQLVNEWLDDGESRQLTLLGDLGTGKSFLARIVSLGLAKKYLEAPSANPFPVLIDLREADREISREGVVVTHFERNGIEGVSFRIFERSLAEGNVVLILDGFDEMASKVSHGVTVRNFNELMKCVKGRAKVMLTCRTHYFRNRTEEEEVLLGAGPDDKVGPAKDIYWDLIGRPGFRIAYLRPFSAREIATYVRKVRPDDHQEVLKTIAHTYDLMELSSRPLLLEMIVRTAHKLQKSKINAATIYQVFTDVWIKRDQWREVISTDEKRALVTAIAIKFWQTGKLSFHYKELSDYVQEHFGLKHKDPKELAVVDHEVRTASFLTRDAAGNYGFAHKSYAEFFLAAHLSEQLVAGRVECLNGRRLTSEIASFVKDLVTDGNVEALLERILQSSYRLFVSENALLLLYYIKLHQSRSQAGDVQAKIVLPLGAKLAGAQLSQVNLERCVLHQADLRGADLSQSVLVGADFSGADLTLTKLDKAELSDACLAKCVMAETSLSGATALGLDLSAASLTKANLSYVDLSAAIVNSTILRDVILANTVLPERLAGAFPSDTKGRIREIASRTVGDNDATWTVINKSWPQIVALAQRTALVTGLEAEDLTTETVLHLFSSRDAAQFPKWEKKEFNSYVANAIRKIAIDQSRKARQAVSMTDLVAEEFEVQMEEGGESEFSLHKLNAVLEQFSVPDETGDPMERVERDEIVALARARLSPQFRRIMESIIAGYTPAEIADQEKLPIDAVGRAIERIRRVVREIIGNADSDDIGGSYLQ